MNRIKRKIDILTLNDFIDNSDVFDINTRPYREVIHRNFYGRRFNSIYYSN